MKQGYKITKGIIIAIVFLCFLSCNKDRFDSIPHGYYTKEYKNWAWGYSHGGWMINGEGRVMSFNLPDSWNNLDSLGYITEAALIENVSNCDSEIDVVSKSTLYKYNKLIDDAANGAISEPINHGADQGQFTYYCYQFDKNLDAYKRILLDVTGDYHYHNQSSEAETISKWLKK